MREEVGVLGKVVDVGMDRFVQLLEGAVACTRVGYDGAGLKLHGKFSGLASGCIVALVDASDDAGAVAYIADVCRSVLG